VLDQPNTTREPAARTTGAIRVLLVDDHPALRTGLERVLASEPGLIPVGSAENEFALWPALNRLRPDVVLMDYSLPGSDGLTLCFRVKQIVPSPAVLLYSAYADPSLAVPARVAQADGLIHKAAPVTELLDGIRMVARGETVMPRVAEDLLTAASSRLDPDDVAMMGMLLHRTPINEIAEVLEIDIREVVSGGLRVVGRLQAKHAAHR
jgi:DNA-binding NarL/FixJ family response regulator